MNFTEARATAQLLQARAEHSRPDPARAAALVDTLSFAAGAALEIGPILSEASTTKVCAAITARVPARDPSIEPDLDPGIEPDLEPNTDLAIVEERQSIHAWFGLSYGSYLVLPRILMQNMPLGWQHRLTALVDELRESFRHVDQAEDYQVLPGQWIPVDELTELQRRALNLTSSADGVSDDVAPDATAEEAEAADRAYDHAFDTQVYYDATGRELHPGERVFVPGRDPLPGYRHATPITPSAPPATTAPDATAPGVAAAPAGETARS